MTDQRPKILPLNDLHQAAQAKFGTFAGWSMPLSYPLGVMKEHQFTREHAGLFDISHMKMILVEGPGAAAALSSACPIDADAIAHGHCKYTFLLDDAAGILDDLIVTRLKSTRYIVVANAGNADADVAHLTALAVGHECVVIPLDRVFLAVQGPEAESVLRTVGLDTEILGFMNAHETKDGWFVSRSGYTGEDGFEIGLPADAGRKLVETLLQDERVAWIGLAARDSLRLEAGLCLHGQDITDQTDPVAAGLIWAVPKTLRSGGTYLGADSLHKHVALGASEHRVGLKPAGRQPVRGGAMLFDESGREVGRVTSGGFGPSVGFPVAMGYVAARLAQPETLLFADVRGTKVPVAVAKLPFFPHRSRKG